MLPNCTRKMGTGDYFCIAMSGGAPWGFRLQGGKEQKQPLQIAKVRSKSKAAKAGLCEGDEVVSINGKPCGDLTYAEVIVLMESLTDVLQMLIKRYRNAQNALVQFCSVNHVKMLVLHALILQTYTASF
uniref:Synaptopodin-2 n=1 Tax=Strigops habroptila TaxID=2489341 RepID=A0A672UNX9_STRHB